MPVIGIDRGDTDSTITCHDEATGQGIIHRFESSEEYHQVWSAFMGEFVPVLVKNGWYSARLQADGYLRWAVDSWNDSPTVTAGRTGRLNQPTHPA